MIKLALFQAIERVLSPFGAIIDETLKLKTLGLPGSDWAPIVIDYCNLNGLLEPVDLISQWESNLSELIYTVKPMLGAVDLIESLVANRIQLGVATSASLESFSKKRFSCNI